MSEKTTDLDVQAQLDTLAVEIADLKTRVTHLEGGASYSSTETESEPASE